MNNQNQNDPAGSVMDLREGAQRAFMARLLRELGASFAAIASQTRSQEAAAAWIETWARHIRAAGLTRQHIEHGLASLDRWPEGEPFNWPTFARLCNPTAGAGAAGELDALRSAFVRREFCDLAPPTWQAGCRLGIARLFHADGVTASAWAAALADAHKTPDPIILALQPRVGQPQIDISEEARNEANARNLVCKDAELMKLPPSLRPRRLAD